MNEIEIYAGIEPIGGMVGVSEPPKVTGPQTPEQAKAIFKRIARSLGAGRKGKRRR